MVDGADCIGEFCRSKSRRAKTLGLCEKKIDSLGYGNLLTHDEVGRCPDEHSGGLDQVYSNEVAIIPHFGGTHPIALNLVLNDAQRRARRSTCSPFVPTLAADLVVLKFIETAAEQVARQKREGFKRGGGNIFSCELAVLRNLVEGLTQRSQEIRIGGCRGIEVFYFFENFFRIAVTRTVPNVARYPSP